MGKITPASRYKHSGHVTWRRVDEDAVILDLESSGYFSLNDVGALIWEKLGAGAELGEIRDAVCAEYEVEEAPAARHIEALVEQLLKAKLIESR